MINILNKSAIGMMPKTTFLLFLVFSDTSLEIAIGRESVARVINSPYVGITSI